jgi:nicotinate-nucleotide pyrophosphorylase (carboxylating)
MSVPRDVLQIIDLALAEDVGEGDWTTLWTVPEERLAEARIVAKAKGVIAGLEVARLTFARVDPRVEFEEVVTDGDTVTPGSEVARLRGHARSLLTGERVALNFLQRLSGVATRTRDFVDAVAGTGARILDTRKTTPGMRWLEKQAVLAGGGTNHRFGLHDMVLIKENHIRAAGGITGAVAAVEERNTARLAVEVEVTDLDELDEALATGIDRVLLDNMPLETLREAVRRVRAAGSVVKTEASGGISLKTVRDVADTGVDYISVGALTHSAPALDLSLLFERG